MSSSSQLPTGRVVSLDGVWVDVEVDAMPVCERCASGHGCGAGLLAPTRRSRIVSATIGNALRPVVGDRVCIELADTNLLRAAFLTYGVPLIFMLGTVAVGVLVTEHLHDLAAIGLAGVGLLCGWAFSAYRLRQVPCQQQFVPRVISIDSADMRDGVKVGRA